MEAKNFIEKGGKRNLSGLEKDVEGLSWEFVEKLNKKEGFERYSVSRTDFLERDFSENFIYEASNSKELTIVACSRYFFLCDKLSTVEGDFSLQEKYIGHLLENIGFENWI